MNCLHRTIILLIHFSLAVTSISVAQSTSVDSSDIRYDSVTSIYGELSPEHLDTIDESEGAVVEKPAIYNNTQPDSTQWRTITGDDAYSYRDKREFVQVQEEKEDQKSSTLLHIIEELARFLQSGTGKLLLWISLFLIVGYIVYRLISGQGSGLFGKKSYTDVKEAVGYVTEQHLLESNWDEQLSSALSKGERRLAIRFSYMRLLQIMQEKGIIAYSIDKTNSQYYRELTDPAVRQSFREISRQYEYTWYGNYLPSTNGLELYMQHYNSIKKLLGSA